MALFSTTTLVIGSGLAAVMLASVTPAMAAEPREVVIVVGAVKDASSLSNRESASDRAIPMLPVVYDDLAAATTPVSRTTADTSAKHDASKT
ncbi:MAG TPA: hypothetical protein VHL34_15855 [Rhizomicrobium sp.]|jgi:hypothetical protein|nr:hypothetical protein [Rhizomicrobium sp.]